MSTSILSKDAFSYNPSPPPKKVISMSSNTVPGIDALAHCVAAIGAAARAAVAAISAEDRVCMQEAVKSTQTAAAEAAAAPAAAAPRTSAQVRPS
jgi:precorrin-3B methylase